MGGVTPIGVAFLAAIVLTGWTGVMLLLTPSFVLLVLPPLADPLKTQARRLYRSVTRFVYVFSLSHGLDAKRTCKCNSRLLLRLN